METPNLDSLAPSVPSELSTTSEISSVIEFDNAANVSSETLVHVQKAYEYYAANNIQEAMNLIQRDSKLAEIPYCQVLLGNCHRHNNNIDQALLCWKKAIDLSPKEYAAYLNIGNVQYAQNNLQQAIAFWTKAYSIRPESVVINLNLAVAYNKKGSWVKSTKFFERYMRFFRGDSNKQYESVKETLYRLRIKADFYFKKLQEVKEEGSVESIISLYKKIISTYSNVPTVYYNLANVLLYSKSYANALEVFMILYKYYPEFSKVTWCIAELYNKLGKKDYAYCFYKRSEAVIAPTSTKYRTLQAKINGLMYIAKSDQKSQEHLELAKEFEADNMYEEALMEYENSLMLAITPPDEVEIRIDELRMYTDPDETIIGELHNEINDCMNMKKLERCIALCDRIILLSDGSSQKGMYAIRCKTECKRLLMQEKQEQKVETK